jgi:sugar/nucleoside kinase (ribokinase family)
MRGKSEMPILVVGTVAFDSVRTPSGARSEILGGSASHFSVAASFFEPVRLTAVVGEDFGEEPRRLLRDRGVDLAGLRTVTGRTFRWSGDYADDLNNPRTLETQLNVIAEYEPVVPSEWSDTPVLFLANIDPEIQGRVLDQAGRPGLVAADTMNFWIASKPDAVRDVFRRVHVVFMNDAEIGQLTGSKHLLDAAEEIRSLGPAVVVIKRGEHGVLVVSDDDLFSIPAFPVRRVVDPTGAGDTFAGGFLGFLASADGTRARDWRRAAVVGTVMASYQVEDFSLDRLRRLSRDEIASRYEEFRVLTRIEPFGA